VRSIVPPYELDIWLPDKSIAIEYHGIYWHSFQSPETPSERRLHRLKADLARQHNILLLQIFETEWLQKRKLLESIIATKLGLVKHRIYARNCVIRTPSNQEYRDFLNDHHLQGFRSSSYKIGLYHNDSLQMVIGISRHPTESHELIRLATRRNTIVVGGLSRLLNRARDDLSLRRLLSYVDRRYSNGRAYSTNGFQHVLDTEPNYFYTTGDKSQPLMYRQSFQKHKLENKLDNFNPNLSECQNMFSHGWRRIWDAGHMKFIKSFAAQ